MATTGDLASLAQAVAGDLAQVETIIPPAAESEAFEPRPSDLARLKGAAVVVRVGLGYDHWLDKLLSMHGDAAVNRRGAGYVDGSFGIPLLEVRGSSVDPANQDGHAHGLANPHYWLDPGYAEIITGGIAEAVIRVAPALAAKVISGRDIFSTLEGSPHRLGTAVAPIAAHALSPITTPGRISAPLPPQHRRCDRDQGRCEPKPGKAREARSDDPPARMAVIMHEPFAPEDASQLLARRTGAVVVKLAPSVFVLPATGGYAELFDYNVGTLARALSAASN